MKLKQWIEMQGNYYGQDWSDTVVDMLIHITNYVDESDIKYNCERLQNFIIENVEVANSNQIKLYDFLEPHIDKLNELMDEEYDVIEWCDMMVLFVGGNCGEGLTAKVLAYLKESIENPTMRTWIHTNLDSLRPYARITYSNDMYGGNVDEWNDEQLRNTLFEDYTTRCEYQEEDEIKNVFLGKIHRFMVFNMENFNAKDLDNQETFFASTESYTLEEVKEQYGNSVHDSLMQTQSFLRGNVKTTFMNDYKNVFYYRTIIEVEHTKTKMLACIYNTETKEMY